MHLVKIKNLSVQSSVLWKMADSGGKRMVTGSKNWYHICKDFVKQCFTIYKKLTTFSDRGSLLPEYILAS